MASIWKIVQDTYYSYLSSLTSSFEQVSLDIHVTTQSVLATFVIAI